jgi:hypothetical protein
VSRFGDGASDRNERSAYPRVATEDISSRHMACNQGSARAPKTAGE